jgi:uncharacterized protein involved in outer membrane biogenesis
MQGKSHDIARLLSMISSALDPLPAPPSRHRSLGRARLSGLMKASLAIVALAVLWTGLMGRVLPDWARPRIEAAATEALGAPVRLGQLKVHPWSLSVEALDLAIGPATQPWLKLQQAEAQLSLESVWRLAPVLRRVTLTRPELDLERLGEDRFNVSPLIDRLSQPDPQAPTDEAPARFAVFNITLRDGVVRLRDRVLEQDHRIDQIGLQVPFVSSLPSHVDVHVQPLLQARVNGSRLKLEGRTRPFSEGFHSELSLDWQDVDLAAWLRAARPLLPPAWRPDARAGRLDTRLDIVFEQRRPPALPMLAIRGQASVAGLDLSLPAMPGLPTPSGAGRLDASWDSLKLTGLDAQPLARQARVAQVSLEGLAAKLRPAAVAEVTPPRGTPPTAPPAQPPSPTPPAPWQWAVDKLRLTARDVDVQTQADAPWPRLAQLVLDVSGLDARAKAPPASWQLSVLDEHQGRVDARGTVQPSQATAEVHLDVRQLAVVPWVAPVAPRLDLPLTPQEGRLALNTHLRLTPSGALLLDQTVVTLSDAQATGRAGDRIGFRELRLDGAEAELGLIAAVERPASPQANPPSGLRRLSLGTVTLASLDAAVSRDATGRWTGQGPAPAKAVAPTPTAPAEPVSSAPAVSLAEFRCQDCALRFTDHTVSPAAAFRLQHTDLSVKNLSTQLDQVLKVALQTQAQGQGKVGFTGDIRPQPLSVKGAVSVAALDLRALQPYLQPHLNVTLGAAQVQARGRVQLEDRPRSGLQGRYQGQLGLRDLRLRDRVNDALFLRWSSLSLDGVDLAHGPAGTDADLGFIAVKDFYGRVIINPDGQLNLASIVRQQGQAEGQSITTPQASSAPVQAAAAQAAAASPSRPDVQLRWQGIHLEKGEVDFTDTFIQPNYSARLTRIAGDISAVSSRTPEPATVEVAGAVDDGAPLRISGRLHPLGPRLYTDIQGVAKGIELTRLTPYSARYAGYAIEKGTLSVTVRYKVDGGKLDADNAVFLDQLTFGERVDSPDATSLPVQLAVSLLKNSRGEIDINLPVSGSLDDPQFSVGGIIWKVLVNILSKAVTAPFALLTGGDSSELGSVPFEPGVGVLGTAARERLDTLIGKLKDRPALKLEATGWADPDLDNEGLRQAHVEQLMRRAKARATGQDPAEVGVAPAERSTWLKAAYQAADIKKPRNLIGLTQTLPDEQMTALLKASATVNRDALVDLADTRADAVKAYLVERLPPERVLLTASKVAAEGQANDKSGGASVQFNLR